MLVMKSNIMDQYNQMNSEYLKLLKSQKEFTHFLYISSLEIILNIFKINVANLYQVPGSHCFQSNVYQMYVTTLARLKIHFKAKHYFFCLCIVSFMVYMCFICCCTI